MVIVHRDNGIYSLDPNSEYITELLWGFYYSKFEKILKSKNIPYKLGYYENYEGDYYIGRFAHAIPDKELHSEQWEDTTTPSNIQFYFHPRAKGTAFGSLTESPFLKFAIQNLITIQSLKKNFEIMR